MDDSIRQQIDDLLASHREKEASPIAARYVSQNTTDAEGWFLLSRCVEKKERKLECLDRALKMRPNMLDAKIAQIQLTTPIVEATSETSSEPVNAVRPPVLLPPLKQAEAVRVPVIPQDKAEVIVKPQLVRAAQRTKQAGESTSKVAAYYAGLNKLDRLIFYLFWGTLILGVPLVFIFPNKSLQLLVLAFLIYFLLNYILKFEKDSRKKKATYAKGAKGELAVGIILETLGDEFKVWHDVPGKYGNIDHVVLSKKGQIFMIETKAHSGRVKLQGERVLINVKEPEKDMIRQCLGNLFDLRDVVQGCTGETVFVGAILVFTNAFVEFGKPIKNIVVTNKKYLKSAIANMMKRMKDDPKVWEKVDALDELFSKENLSYKEFKKENFEWVSGWG